MSAIIDRAIDLSIQEDRIVHLSHADLSDEDMTDLFCRATGTGGRIDPEQGSEAEYWGEDGSSGWRVHVCPTCGLCDSP